MTNSNQDLINNQIHTNKVMLDYQKEQIKFNKILAFTTTILATTSLFTMLVIMKENGIDDKGFFIFIGMFIFFVFAFWVLPIISGKFIKK